MKRRKTAEEVAPLLREADRDLAKGLTHRPAELAALEDKIVQAFKERRVRRCPRLLNADCSPAGGDALVVGGIPLVILFATPNRQRLGFLVALVVPAVPCGAGRIGWTMM